MKRLMISTLLCALAACGTGAGEAAQGGAMVVDSAVSIPAALARFQAALPATAGMTGGFHTRDSLVAAVASALAARDTAALLRLQMTQAEFAYLYYPSNPQSKPPYELPPELMWFQMQQQADRGLSRLLDRFGGRSLSGYECDSPRLEADNTIYPRCRLAGDAPIGTVVERREGFKILSYANEL
jgi:hypothetical protein